MPDFSNDERTIKELFEEVQRNNSLVSFCGDNYHVSIVGKPTCVYGEPKTDVYILLSNDDDEKEIKISIKKSNADFLENKISAERAEAFFGTNWKDIVIQSVSKLRTQFANRSLIYKRKSGKTEAGCITLGWKFELLNKISGELSAEIEVDLKDVYRGTNLCIDKKNANVNGTIIENSGVAEYLLVIEDISHFTDAQIVLDKLIHIDTYIEVEQPKIYFACKALNYRSLHVPPKWDGDRPLSVYVDWSVENGKLCHEIKFDNPLTVKGNLIARQLENCLRNLQISSTAQLNSTNIDSLNILFE